MKRDNRTFVLMGLAAALLCALLFPQLAWAPYGGVGGVPVPTELGDLTDVESSSLAADQDVLIWDSATQGYIHTAESSGDGDTTYNAGNGVNLAGTTFSADASTYITVNSSGISVQASTLEAALDLDNIPGTLGSDQMDANTIFNSDVAGWCGTEDYAITLGAGGALDCTEMVSGSGAAVAYKNVATDSGTAIADSSTDTLTMTGATGIDTSATADTVTFTPNEAELEALLDHDDLNGFVATEHLDWTSDQGGTNIAQANVPTADAADALSANGANCTAGSIPLGVDASGAAEGCYAPSAFESALEAVMDLEDMQGTATSAQIAADMARDSEVSVAAIDASPPMDATTIGGSALTIATYPIMKAQVAITITDIHCITDTGTVILQLEEGTGTAYDGGTVVDGTITCDSDGAEDDGTLSNGTIDAGDWIAARIGTEASSPTILGFTFYYTVD